MDIEKYQNLPKTNKKVCFAYNIENKDTLENFMFFTDKKLTEKDNDKLLHFGREKSLIVLDTSNVFELFEIELDTSLYNYRMSHVRLSKFIIGENHPIYCKRVLYGGHAENLVLDYLEYMVANIFKTFLYFVYGDREYNFEKVLGADMRVVEDFDFLDIYKDFGGVESYYKNTISNFTTCVLFAFLVDDDENQYLCNVSDWHEDGCCDTAIEKYLKKLDNKNANYEYIFFHDAFEQTGLYKLLVPDELNNIRKMYNIKSLDGFARFLKHFFDVCINYYNENNIRRDFGLEFFNKTKVDGINLYKDQQELDLIKKCLCNSKFIDFKGIFHRQENISNSGSDDDYDAEYENLKGFF